MNSLIRDALIEGKTTEEHYEKDGYAVRWTFFNELELIFVVRPTQLSGVSRDQPYPPTLPRLTPSLTTGCIPAYPTVDLRR